ncbi:MAG TPA: hypothetical protein EYN69_00655 [Flavobacteriales bacterium]|nr:hypothetical protein [Flavobacteriales bacterium]
MRISTFSLLLTLCLTVYAVYDTHAQDSNRDEVIEVDEIELAKEADIFMEKKNFLAALPLFEKLFKNYPNRIEYKLALAICYTYKSGEKEKAVKFFEEILLSDPKSKHINYELGRAYHLTSQFDKALVQLKIAKGKKGSKDKEKNIIELIRFCGNGIELIQNPVDVEIENMGPVINSSGSEYVPVISSDESMLIFTYAGKNCIGGLQNQYGQPDPKGYYYEDILVSYKIGNLWLTPEDIGSNINSSAHDACVALSGDGQKLFVYRDTDEGSGEIFMSELEGNVWLRPIKMNININTEHWEGSASLSPDERTLYFTSERPGGQGGRDIYKSEMREDGIWDEAINVGPQINTEYDDDAPFIHPDNKTLYFSSMGHNSLGGYDIFSATRTSDTAWAQAVNIGYPINTPEDDVFYVMAANGKRGYYSSARDGSFGQHDIFVVHQGKEAIKHALVLVKGRVTANDRPAEVSITVTYAANAENQGIYKSNSASGMYLISLPAGNDYTIKYELEGYFPQTEIINASAIDYFTEMVINVKLYSATYQPLITIEGNLYYSENPLRPAAYITMFVKDKKGAATIQTTSTDSRGYFRFTNLQPTDQYFITLDEKDPELKAYISPVIVGSASKGKTPKANLKVNESITDDMGSFRIVFSDGKFLYTNLPADPARLEQVNFEDPDIYQEILDKFGNIKVENLIFKVQIGAYQDAANFDNGYISSVHKVSTQVLKDGITRFTIGELITLNEAEDLKLNAIGRGCTDAFILIFYKGKRRLLLEAVANGFFETK